VAERDHPSNPGTEAFVPDFGDTGEDSVPFVPNFSDDGDTDSQPSLLPLVGKPEPKETPESPETPSPDAAAVHSVTVPGRYQYLKWWKLTLVILGVWIAAAEVGLSLFYWWFHTVDRTAAAFMVLVYVVACVVAGVMLAMVQGRPLISALSIAVMSGPFASAAAAAPLYGYYYCVRAATHCVVGVIPY
jgi:hypothetical protein